TQQLQAPVRIRGRLGTHHPGRAPPRTPDHREPAVSKRPHLAPAPRQHVALLQHAPAETPLRRPQANPQHPRGQPRQPDRPSLDEEDLHAYPGDSNPGSITTTGTCARQAMNDDAKLDAQMPNSLLSHTEMAHAP